MQIKRVHATHEQKAPYTLTFEIDRCIHYNESNVAANALSIRPYTADLLGLPELEILAMAHLSARIGASDSVGNRSLQTSLYDVKRLGAGLMLYADSTQDDLQRLQATNPQFDRLYTVRRLEGAMARGMAQAIVRRGISIQTLWQPDSARRRPVGFASRIRYSHPETK